MCLHQMTIYWSKHVAYLLPCVIKNSCVDAQISIKIRIQAFRDVFILLHMCCARKPVVYLRTRFDMPVSTGLLISKPEAEENFHTLTMLLFYFLQSRPINLTEVAYFSNIYHKALLWDHRISGNCVKECDIEMSNGVNFVSDFVEVRQLVSKLKRGRGRARAHTHTHTDIAW